VVAGARWICAACHDLVARHLKDFTTMSRMTPKQPDTDRPRDKMPLLHADLTAIRIAGFYEVYNTLGYGFAESVYSKALFVELELRGLHVQREVLLDVYYKARCVGKYRVDFLVNQRVVIENKATRWLVQSDRDQLLNGLRCSSLEVGLLFHFGPKPKFYRVVSTNAHRD
jgi:GxxExxY protein